MRKLKTGVLGWGLSIFLGFALANPASAEDPPPFLLEWGSPGTADGQFNNPLGISTDSLGNVYVSDVANNRMQKFDAEGEHLLSWGSEGTGDGQFHNTAIRGVAVGPGDVIYVVDSADNNRVQVFDTDGNYQDQFSIGPGPGGRFANGIAVNATTGDVYVAVGGGNVCPCDGQHYFVRQYTSAGTFIREWGNNGPSSAPGKFTRPFAIAVDQIGNVYVLESFAARVQVFDSEGNFLSANTINSTGSGDGFFFDAAGLAVDNSGNVYIGDRAGQRIQKFDPAGNFVTKWGGPGTGDGQFNRPDGITVTPGGIVYVADSLNHRIQKFGVANFVEPLAHDFGQVNAFTSQDTIVTISNTGAANLTVNNVVVTTGTSNFIVADIDPAGFPPFTLLSGEDVFVTVTFFPTFEGVHAGTLTVDSDHPDDPIVLVSLIGNGLVGAVEGQATVLETAIDDSIAFGGLVGSGSGNSSTGRLNAFANQIEAAGDLIEAGFIDDACGQLRSALRRVDGNRRPPDFVTGDDAVLIADQIRFLRDSLECDS